MVENENNELVVENEKKKNELVCKWCKKQFKRKTPKKTHELKQLCVSKNNRMYCEYCDISFNILADYEKHIVSDLHFKNIFSTSETKLKISSIKNKLDPYLTESEQEELDNFKISNVTLKYYNNMSERINLNVKSNIEKEIEKEKDKEDYINEVISRNNNLSYKDIIENEIYNLPTPNENQNIILSKLYDARDNLSDEKKELFLHILKNINENDADFMSTYIRNCVGLDLESKQIYLELINKFINKLTEIYNKGYLTIGGGKDIKQLITKLSK
jgi:hypothetical protein